MSEANVSFDMLPRQGDAPNSRRRHALHAGGIGEVLLYSVAILILA